MTETVRIEIERIVKSRLPEVDFEKLPFGKVYTDHMFIADYRNGEWRNARIVPYGVLPMSPSNPAIHYGQTIFEGMKAYRGQNGEVLLFRPKDHWRRLNVSAERMCMPAVPEELFMESLRELIELDRAWIPEKEGAALYVRPFMLSADEYIGIRPSEAFQFIVILCPVGSYYTSPVKVKIETHYTRAIAGGTGYVKAGGNYGGAIYPAKLAQDQGYHQLLWTDGQEHKFIEESGTMNVMFIVNDVLITPALSDSILAGITRDSVLKLARKQGLRVEERRISVDELVTALKDGVVSDAFGAGTAATIAPISVIGHEGVDYTLPPVEQRRHSQSFLTALNRIKYGTDPDPFGWVVTL
jgi:branched-chain amino acid aminotransferase